MTTVDFTKFYNYFQNAIINKKTELFAQGRLERDLSFRFYNNSGEYFTDIQQPDSDDVVLCNIIDDGGVQDSSVAIDTYVKIISFEMLALDEYRSDLIEIFTDFCASYKSLTTEIDSQFSNITIDEFPEFSEKFDAHGYEKFNIKFTANVVVMDAKLSNTNTLLINGQQVKFGKVTLSRTKELMPHLKKQAETTFFPNSSVFQVKINGLYTENPALRTLLNDCTRNDNFSQYYQIQLIESDGNVLVDKNMFIKDSVFDLGYGSIVAYDVVFYTGERVGG